MSPKGLFWRFAHDHFATRRMSVVPELCFYGLALFFVLMFAVALDANYARNIAYLPLGIALTLIAIIPGMLHHRIRVEKAKGPLALQEKRLASDPGYNGPPTYADFPVFPD